MNSLNVSSATWGRGVYRIIFNAVISIPVLKKITNGTQLCLFALIFCTFHTHSIFDLHMQCARFVPKVSVLIFLFKCLLDSPEFTSYILQSMTLRKLQSGSNVFSPDHSSTGSHFL